MGTHRRIRQLSRNMAGTGAIFCQIKGFKYQRENSRAIAVKSDGRANRSSWFPLCSLTGCEEQHLSKYERT